MEFGIFHYINSRINKWNGSTGDVYYLDFSIGSGGLVKKVVC